jgi:hypothetical protein
VSLNAAAVELTNALKTVRLLWEEARAEWDDSVARDFEARWWAPLDAQVRAVVGAMDRVAPVLSRAREECS